MREEILRFNFSASDIVGGDAILHQDPDTGRMYKTHSIYGFVSGESEAPDQGDVNDGLIGPGWDTYTWAVDNTDDSGANRAKVIRHTVDLVVSEEEAAAFERTNVFYGSAVGTSGDTGSVVLHTAAHSSDSDTGIALVEAEYPIPDYLTTMYFYEYESGTFESDGVFYMRFNFIKYLPDELDLEPNWVAPLGTDFSERGPTQITSESFNNLPKLESYASGVCELTLEFEDVEVPVEPNHTTFTVFKIWNNTPADKIPEAVSIQLYCDGEVYGPLVTLTAATSWLHNYEHLEDLEEHEWTVEEYTPAGFESEIVYSDYAAVLTNTYTVAPLMSYHVVAVWDDETGDPRPAYVKVQLQYLDMIYNENEGPEYISYGDEETLWPQKDWRHEFTNLPSDRTWRVVPVGIPDKYTVAVTHVGNTTILTYSYQKSTVGGGDVDDSGATGDINQTYLVSGATLKEIANAIRSKTGISGALNITNFASAIASLEIR